MLTYIGFGSSSSSTSQKTSELQSVISDEIKKLMGFFHQMIMQEPGYSAVLKTNIVTLENLIDKPITTIEKAFTVVKQNIQYFVADNIALQSQLDNFLAVTLENIYQLAPSSVWSKLVDEYNVSIESTVYDSEAAHKKVLSLLPSKESQAALYSDTNFEKQTTARHAFLQYLEGILNHYPEVDTIPKPSVYITTLLEAEGLKLYQAAIEEERRSIAFRDAVFLSALRPFSGHTLGKKVVLFITAPSGAGKTYYSMRAFQEAIKHISSMNTCSSSSTDTSKGHAILIDGSIERKMSQVRQMVLQVALAKGFKGIEDLYGYTVLACKDYIKECALADPNLSMIITETMASSMLTDRFSTSGAYKQKEMKRYHDDQRIMQIFCEIVADPDNPTRFPNTLALSADIRAWFPDNQTFKQSDIKMNNRDIPCESKSPSRYSYYFASGAPNTAREIYKQLEPEGFCLEIIHSLIYVKKDLDNNWQECIMGDTPIFKLSSRDFLRWKQLRFISTDTKDLIEWWHDEDKAGRIVEDDISIHYNKDSKCDAPSLSFSTFLYLPLFSSSSALVSGANSLLPISEMEQNTSSSQKYTK